MNDTDRQNIARILDSIASNDEMSAADAMLQLLDAHPKIVDALSMPEYFGYVGENGED